MSKMDIVDLNLKERRERGVYIIYLVYEWMDGELGGENGRKWRGEEGGDRKKRVRC